MSSEYEKCMADVSKLETLVRKFEPTSERGKELQRELAAKQMAALCEIEKPVTSTGLTYLDMDYMEFFRRMLATLAVDYISPQGYALYRTGTTLYQNNVSERNYTPSSNYNIITRGVAEIHDNFRNEMRVLKHLQQTQGLTSTRDVSYFMTQFEHGVRLLNRTSYLKSIQPKIDFDRDEREIDVAVRDLITRADNSEPTEPSGCTIL